MKGLAKWHSESRMLVIFSAAEVAATFARDHTGVKLMDPLPASLSNLGLSLCW